MSKNKIHKKYLYAVIDSSKEMRFSFRGLEKRAVYTLPYKDISAVVSDLDRVRGDLNEDHIIAHERVVEKLMNAFTVLPVRFFTLLNSEEAVSVMLEHLYEDFVKNLNHVRGKVELGIKVLWPAEGIKLGIINSAVSETSEEDSPGKRHMLKKLRDYTIEKQLQVKATEYIKTIDGTLTEYASDKILEPSKTEKLLLIASYLVEKERINAFKVAFSWLQDEFKDFKFLLSGPWPAYNFVNIPIDNQFFKKETK